MQILRNYLVGLVCEAHLVHFSAVIAWYDVRSHQKGFCRDAVWAVFELRKNKWLSHGQSGYNFWLSVQVLVVRTWNIQIYTYNNEFFSYRSMVVHRTTASIFLVVRRLFGRTDNQNFERWVWASSLRPRTCVVLASVFL